MGIGDWGLGHGMHVAGHGVRSHRRGHARRLSRYVACRHHADRRLHLLVGRDATSGDKQVLDVLGAEYAVRNAVTFSVLVLVQPIELLAVLLVRRLVRAGRMDIYRICVAAYFVGEHSPLHVVVERHLVVAGDAPRLANAHHRGGFHEPDVLQPALQVFAEVPLVLLHRFASAHISLRKRTLVRSVEVEDMSYVRRRVAVGEAVEPRHVEVRLLEHAVSRRSRKLRAERL